MVSLLCRIFNICVTLFVLIIFCISFNKCWVKSAQFRVIGPDWPLTAIVGQDILLPCQLSPKRNAKNMQVRWFQFEFDKYVHLYQDGKDHNSTQVPEYQGRTTLLKDEVVEGNVSLRIFNVRFSDEGKYHCFVQDEADYEEAILELKVAGLGSVPLISVEDYQDGGIRMTCQSAGWYPEPEVLWRNTIGQHLPSLSETKSQKEDGLFETQNAIVIQQHSKQNLSCWIKNNFLNQEKESAIYISDPFFPRVNPWMVVLCGNLVVLFGFLVLAVCLFRMRDKLHKDIGRHLQKISELQLELGWRRTAAHPANLTLDPETAHPELVLSKDQKSVRWGDTRQDLPDNPGRFDFQLCVLGLERFASGRHYWEVEVGEGGAWAVGVARESVQRKGEVSPNPQVGIWAVVQLGGRYRALTAPDRTPLSLSQILRRVGVYLNYEEGRVEFFDADIESSIFIFSVASFAGERLCPWIRIWDRGPDLRLRY
ncbi:butyrophilin subfamily 1 member A1-like [Alligator sinensis]|uniref:Butyrophilin subfamily 1 member A1-like n=1 Tax=Alligator sinensis TaxID=38654 RepID=A0A1U7SLB9_ALLSI|nr:butyrophilin subfamily 1 member A1-like [Alligator sinensis]